MTEPRHVGTSLEEYLAKFGPRDGIFADHPTEPDEHGGLCSSGFVTLDDGSVTPCLECAMGLREERWQKEIPSRYHGATLADFAGVEGSEGLTEWSEDHRHRNLVIFGPVGTGKTHAAVAACREHFRRGRSVGFYPEGQLLNTLRPPTSVHEVLKLSWLDLMILDDFGTDRPTEWGQAQIYDLVNKRWQDEEPTVVTTNMAPDALEKVVGPRLFSRLIGSDAVVVRLSGKDRRRS